MEQPLKKNYRKKSYTGKKGKRAGWIIGVTLASFILSGGLLLASSSALDGASVYAAISIVFIIVLIGIVFDTVGISVASARVSVFHSMAAKRIYGAKQAIWLVNNADKVSSICNDVVGDICGVISGSASTLIIISIVGNLETNPASWPSLIVSGTVAALTVGGKAIGKVIAIKQGTKIVQKAGAVTRFILGKRKSANDN
ncbi:MAG: Mg2+ and Co2+ transporter CorB [Clostridia bacterium]|nr:Mg2+ and Co2+ transporter CorB [Clostridia bacterium]